MSKWEYGGFYHEYDMNGVIELPNNSEIQVNDLILHLPEFMKQADTLFIDPPCSKGNLTSFYTKADKSNTSSFLDFQSALFKRILEIKPKYLFLEVFKSNKDAFKTWCKQNYESVEVYESTYYNNKKNVCWVIHATNESQNTYYPELNGLDEEKIIAWICKNHKFDCIGDLCMGQGLVGKYAFLNKKRFVGTELNKKRLAVLRKFIDDSLSS